MTKAELMAVIASKFYKVPEPELLADQFGIKEYRMFPWVKEGENIYKQHISFCVENEGEPTEYACWSGPEPRVSRPESFTDRAIDFIKAKITDGTIKYGYLVSTDNEMKKGLGIAITTANLKKDVLLVEDASNVMTITII